MVLAVIFWVLIILALAGFWFPEPYVKYARGFDLILFIILGIKVFGLPS
jgi:hypothetical protein